jgi:hypothetical protein
MVAHPCRARGGVRAVVRRAGVRDTEVAVMDEITRLAAYLYRYLHPRVAGRALVAWAVVDRALGGAIIPNAGAVTESHVLLTWNADGHHLEVEVFDDAPAELFYWNRRTDESRDCLLGLL